MSKNVSLRFGMLLRAPPLFFFFFSTNGNVVTSIAEVCHAVVATFFFKWLYCEDSETWIIVWGSFFIIIIFYNFGWGHCRVLSSVPISSQSTQEMTDSRTACIYKLFPIKQLNFYYYNYYYSNQRSVKNLRCILIDFNTRGIMICLLSDLNCSKVGFN